MTESGLCGVAVTVGRGTVYLTQLARTGKDLQRHRGLPSWRMRCDASTYVGFHSKKLNIRLKEADSIGHAVKKKTEGGSSKA